MKFILFILLFVATRIAMSHELFADYARSTELTVDQIYTVESLVEYARGELEEDYYSHGWQERDDARAKPDYRPVIPQEWAAKAGPWLAKAKWISFQRLNEKKRPIRSLDAFQYLRSLTELILQRNEIKDIQPLHACKALKRLDLSRNQIEDMSALKACPAIKELNIAENPVKNLAVLEALPDLETLEISSDQLPVFSKIRRLSKLRKLEIHGDTFSSFEGFPEMPGLRIIWGAHVDDLAGVEKFPSLENLANISGGFVSLAPLKGVKRLTHANLHGGVITDLSPLSTLNELRELWLGTKAEKVDLTPLGGLPKLHGLNIKRDSQELPGVSEFRKKLSGWDIEFQAEKVRHMPSTRLEVVSQEEFDRFDTHEPFGMLPTDGNYELLESELEWLQERIETSFASEFKEREDYNIPLQWGGARSTTIVLLSEEAMHAFPRLVTGIQKALAHARNDWIIYFQSDASEDDFIVWVYPDKIVTTREFEGNVKKLLQAR
ncbi:leucine-rich repeat domain-containing protein [Prosthecobacter sp.]|uniref:leucine-rich repeat domain-containing protein n=1 Tax=Prosthecobacter sp. TaxID=1965333 RepID=UPI0037847AE9